MRNILHCYNISQSGLLINSEEITKRLLNVTAIDKISRRLVIHHDVGFSKKFPTSCK